VIDIRSPSLQGMFIPSLLTVCSFKGDGRCHCGRAPDTMTSDTVSAECCTLPVCRSGFAGWEGPFQHVLPFLFSALSSSKSTPLGASCNRVFIPRSRTGRVQLGEPTPLSANRENRASIASRSPRTNPVASNPRNHLWFSRLGSPGDSPELVIERFRLHSLPHRSGGTGLFPLES